MKLKWRRTLGTFKLNLKSQVVWHEGWYSKKETRMSSPNLPADRSQSPTINGTEPTSFDLQYKPAEDVHPLELIGNAYLALHHHMAPADGGFDLGGEDDD